MRERNSRLDVAKGVLIILVILGHLLPRIGMDDRAVAAVYTVVYAFHMPAFIFLAGITAKSTRLLERVLTFAVLLVTFQVVYYAAEHIAGDPFAWSWTDPHWILWFLAAMIWWTLSTPLIERFPRVLVPVSIAVGLSAGLVPVLGPDLSLSRALVFWPFFVLGQVHGKSLLTMAADLPMWTRVTGAALALLPALVLVVAEIDRSWLYADNGFASLGAGDAYGLLVRACLLLIALLLTAALVTAVPDVKGLVAVIGKRSLSVFLFHGFLVIALTPALDGILPDDPGRGEQVSALALAAAAALGIAVLLSCRPIHWLVTTPPQRIASALAAPVNTLRTLVAAARPETTARDERVEWRGTRPARESRART